MNSYVLYWLHGKVEIVEGNTISDAFSKAGYSAGAIRALDFYDTSDTIDYEYNQETKEWMVMV